MEFPSERMKELLGRNAEVHVYLPPQALQGHTSTHSGLKAPTLGFLMYETLNDILPPHKGDTPQGNESKLLNSRVVSVSLDEGRQVQLPHPVILTFQHLKKDNVSNPACVFWDYTTRFVPGEMPPSAFVLEMRKKGRKKRGLFDLWEAAAGRRRGAG